MNPYTLEYLSNLWSKEQTLKGRFEEHAKQVSAMDFPTTGVIGRDLIIRRRQLFNSRFYLAAFLATESLTGNDGFLDFTDCVAILPQSRYDRITANPDSLIDDPISKEFDELGFVDEVAMRFDELAGVEKYDWFLDYLVFGMDEAPWKEMKSGATIEMAKVSLPRLFQRSGSILK